MPPAQAPPGITPPPVSLQASRLPCPSSEGLSFSLPLTSDKHLGHSWRSPAPVVPSPSTCSGEPHELGSPAGPEAPPPHLWGAAQSHGCSYRTEATSPNFCFTLSSSYHRLLCSCTCGFMLLCSFWCAFPACPGLVCSEGDSALLPQVNLVLRTKFVFLILST